MAKTRLFETQFISDIAVGAAVLAMVIILI